MSEWRKDEKIGNFLCFFLGVGLGGYLGYVSLALFTDLRIDELRPFITETAVNQGVARGVQLYKEEYIKDEEQHARKRKKRDEFLKEYVRRLQDVMDEVDRKRDEYE